MAIGTGNTLAELERSWFAQKVGSANDRLTINELKRSYFINQGASARDLNDLEAQWLRKVISANAATPSNTNNLSTLWIEAVSSAGLTTSKYINNNKQTYYKNVV